MGQPDDHRELLDSLQRTIDAIPAQPHLVDRAADGGVDGGPTDAESPVGDETPDEGDAFREVTKRAYAILAQRDHSRAELRSKLVDRGSQPHIVERLLGSLEHAGLVDDARFAEQFVRSQRESRGKSHSAIARALRDKGVSDDDARGAVEQLGDDFPFALAAARKKAAGTRGLAHDVRMRRTLGVLGRRGFGGSVARRAAEQALGEDDGE